MKKAFKFTPYLFLILGIASLLFVAIDYFVNFKFFAEVSDEAQIIIALLSTVLTAISLERIEQRQNVEEKLDTFMAMLLTQNEKIDALKMLVTTLPSITILEGTDRIHADTTQEIRKAKTHVRATTFRGALDNLEESGIEYYLELAGTIRNKHNFIYECCFNRGNIFTLRKQAFEKLNFSESDYKKMRYYEFENQSYYNHLIIDNRVAYIGFPTNRDRNHMHFVYKLEATNQTERIIIEHLVLWYDEVLKNNGIKQDTLKMFSK